METASDSCDAEKLDSNHPLYILYTSGTTGKPKGVLHETGGYLTHLHSTFQWAFDIKDSDVFFCTADIGWVTGHSYVVYAPLLHGATQVMYEGAPDFPDISRMWDILQKYKVSIFYTTPTALRMFMKFGDDIPNSFDLSSLRLLGTVGEPINPEVWKWYYKVIGKEKCPIIDTWWQTETGGMMISSLPGLETIPLKPGSGTLPIPGVEISVVDEFGDEVPPNTKGYLIIKNPWPGMLQTLWGDDEKYKTVYWSKYPDCYYAGDYAVKDFNIYLTNKTDQELLFETKVEIKPKTTTNPTGLETDTITYPAIFLKNLGGRNEPFAMGGIDETITSVRAIILADSQFNLDAACSILKDKVRTNIQLVEENDYPFNALGGYKSSVYNYTGLAADSSSHVFINDVYVSQFNVDYISEIKNANPDVYSAIVDLDLRSENRQPRA